VRPVAGGGHDAIHPSRLAAQNRTPDETLNELSLREQRVVVTKDLDFYHSHLLHAKPWKLLLVRTGNIRARDLRRRCFKSIWPPSSLRWNKTRWSKSTAKTCGLLDEAKPVFSCI
jgi:predicted nuclease of predicted toxin-antitoxin system